MTIVIPVTGTAKCGKSTLIKQLSDHFLKDKGIPHTFTIDAASLAKDFMDEFLEDKESFSNKLRYGIDFKTDAYRQSLVDIIRALDRFDLRVNEIVRSILSLVIDHYKGESCVIFINIREIDVIKKIEDSIIISSRNEYSTLLSKYGNNSQLRIAQLHHDHLFNKKLLSDFKYKYQNIDYFVHLTDISKNEIEKLVRPYNQRTKFITIPNYVMPYNCEDYKRNNYVISVGRFSHEKGFLRLLDVWAKVVNKNKEWKLLLIGDGPEMNFIKEKMLKLNISEYVECPGFLDNKEVMRLLNKSKIYAMPSYTEAFSFTLVEAMQNKLPAVSFDVRIGPQVLIDNDKNGFLVEDDNVDLFAEKLLTLMDNPLLLKEFSNKAFEKSEDFLEENVIKKWIDILL